MILICPSALAIFLLPLTFASLTPIYASTHPYTQKYPRHIIHTYEISRLSRLHIRGRRRFASQRHVRVCLVGAIGKTTLRKGLQNRLKPKVTYLSTGIDILLREILPEHCFLANDALRDLTKQDTDWFYWEPTSINDSHSSHPTSVTLRCGPKGRKAWLGLVECTLGLVRAGNHVIVDDVCFEGEWQLEAWKSRFELEGVRVVMVGLHCHIDSLVKRERERGDRKMGSAMVQASRVHGLGKDLNKVYDIVIDTRNTTPEDAVAQVVEVCLKKMISRAKTSP